MVNYNQEKIKNVLNENLLNLAIEQEKQIEKLSNEIEVLKKIIKFSILILRQSMIQWKAPPKVSY